MIRCHSMSGRGVETEAVGLSWTTLTAKVPKVLVPAAPWWWLLEVSASHSVSKFSDIQRLFGAFADWKLTEVMSVPCQER